MPKNNLLRNEKLKANRASETEEQRRERLRIRRDKERARRRTKNIKKRSVTEIAPGHSQRIEVR